MSVAEPRELSRDDFRSFLDERVRESLGISLDQFLALLRAGKIDPEDPQVAPLAILVGARAS
jgi:hypothetical protein